MSVRRICERGKTIPYVHQRLEEGHEAMQPANLLLNRGEVVYLPLRVSQLPSD